MKLTIAIIATILILLACPPKGYSQTPTTNKGLIKVTIMYPNDRNKTFDMDYYATRHMPMLAELFGMKMKKYEIDRGLSGRTSEEKIPFLAIGYLYFAKLSDYQEAFAPNADKILGDIPNYTNIQPIVQISEVVK